MVSEPASPTQASPAAAESPEVHSRLAIWIMVGVLALLVFALIGLALMLIPNARAVSTNDTAGALDQRMIRIADQLQCPICEGQSVAFSSSQLAGEMRVVILEKLQAGESEAQIMQYFVDRYGIRILREPPKQGLNLWLWIIPIMGFGIGIAGLLWKLRQMASAQRHVQASDSEDGEKSPVIDSDIQEILVQYDKDLLA